MALDPNLVGWSEGPWERSWTADDALLYAVAVGAGQDDPVAELAVTTENTAGVEQRALPTFGVVLAQFGGPQEIPLGDVDRAFVVHAEQSLTAHRPLPVSGRMSLRRRIVDVFDKGSGALVVVETEGSDVDGPLVTARSSVFVRGQGGFGGPRGESARWSAPEREPDAVLRFRTAVNQALVYRLTGDRNPLHSDPAFARRGGFDRPILHGLCTYGITCRLLVNALCGGDPTRVTGMSGRFTRPVWPGEELVVSVWEAEDGTAVFRTANGSGETVLDRGWFAVR
ncbi:Acyl dehydratase [Streptoalloteichus tenebrarius]|uniref:Acyl dehydratase n=1 Tax=Streptoalloteichus tenebrarius (strain ATCC 17920 / DSM 40477 / JCM 4838 / CBS 697.72 / NBRC 16177 / NCIMB 11028 / NRRL B-12390 / A12253. 1 / ISP 5477) TaxID=1933 RepID=A0ABT1HQE6_STRSD|nr:MaoC/PaaZ C-terminal domain-containing protein [Streptoalloteichus tenebrarius]MCP2257734.1 Acyl dehydratase [Streptoalloteichus tenebrarius]BFE99912.1 MaoC/PaaZ C-terminal domain-containing protein [Streptoalloteichus tenebrarius]